MALKRYVALLRGINVGGKNRVPMAELRSVVESVGHSSVSTYIASGNVLFASALPAAGLESALEQAIEERFGFPVLVVVVSHAFVRKVVEKAPDGFGRNPEEFHSDAIFLKKPLSPAAAMKVVQLRDEVDEAWAANGVLYFARLSARRTQSRMSKIVGTPEYRQMTIRSWATTTKLLALLDEA